MGYGREGKGGGFGKAYSMEDLVYRSLNDVLAITESATELRTPNIPQGEKVAAIIKANKAMITALKKSEEYLRSIGQITMALVIVAAVSGCSSIYDRPEGASPAQWSQATAECNQQGAAVPTILAPVLVDSYAVVALPRERVERVTTVSRDRFGGYQEMSSYHESYGRRQSFEAVPQQTVKIQDINAPRREQIVSGCLRNKAAEFKP